MSASDYSAFYSLFAHELDGSTVWVGLQWGPDTNQMYRQYTLPAPPGRIGEFAVRLFTRSSAEPNNTATPIAETGALIIARCPQASSGATIGIKGRGTNPVSQVQRLTADPSAHLWAFPGDHVWLNDPNTNVAGGLMRVDFYVKPMNYRELDALLALPKQEPPRTGVSFSITNETDLPYAVAPRIVYLVTPPAADVVYFMVPPQLVPVGYEQVFINTSNHPFILEAVQFNGGSDITPRYYVPGRGVVTMISGGGFWAPMGTPSSLARTMVSGQTIPQFRGVLRLVFDLAVNEMFALPDPATIPGDAVLVVTSRGAGDPHLWGTVNGSVTGVSIPQGTAAILRPFGTGWIEVGV